LAWQAAKEITVYAGKNIIRKTAVCGAGVKTVENRTWKTEYRGRLLIHASGDSYSWPDFTSLPEKMRNEINRAVLKLQFQNSFRLKTRFHKALA
jgi:hypothetical protein